MLKKFVSSLLAVICLVGCSGGNSSSSNDTPADLTKKIIADLSLDTVQEVETRVIPGLFFFEDGVYEEGSFYAADKLADCLGVFKVTDVKSAKETVQTYLDTRKSQLQMYAPSEVFKVDNAVIESNADTVIFIVCDDLEKAKETAKAALK